MGIKNLNEFKNPVVTKLDPWVTSVNLDQKHREFIERENLNLSKIVRATLDDLMGQRYNDESLEVNVIKPKK